MGHRKVRDMDEKQRKAVMSKVRGSSSNSQSISISDVKRINKEKGQHFFSKGAMRFFNSRIETRGNLIKGKYFITSEQFDRDSPRLYSVKKFNKESGSIDQVGEFQQFKTRTAAKD